MRIIILTICLLSVLTCQADVKTIIIGQKTPTISGDTIAFANFRKIVPPKNLANNFKIKPRYTGEMQPAMQLAIEAACHAWESLIIAPNPITIDFEYCDSLHEGNIIESLIGFKTVDNIVQPYTLISAYGKEKFSLLNESSDSKIRISEGVDWDYTLDSSIKDKPNLCFYVLRALAQTFGFSTTLCEKELRNKSFPGFFIIKSYSQFDNFVFDSTGKRLCSITTSGSRESTELNTFVCPPSGINVYVLKEDANHKLYTPSKFIYGQSLALLDNTSSMMHYNPAIGTKTYDVDAITLEVLSEIGWEFNVNTPRLSITPLESHNSNEFCAYAPVSFSVSTEEGVAIESPLWVYELPNAEGLYIPIHQDTGDKFTIPSLSSVEQYSHNDDGLIEGKINVYAKVNGIDVTGTYDILLSLKPKIVSAEIVEVKHSDDGRGYSITAKINHLGSDYLSIVLEQEYDPGVRYKTSHTVGLSYVTYDNVSPWVYVWMDIKAVNVYGSDTYTIELDDEFIINNLK